MRNSVLCALLLGICIPAAASAVELPAVTHYSLSYRILPKEERLEAEAVVTVKNSTGQPQAEIPFLLYRLLDVDAVSDESGNALDYIADVVKDADIPYLQVNFLRVKLPRPLPAGDSTKIDIRFSGYVYGYREVWAYVRESISEDYTLLRDDTFAYPMLGGPNRKSRHADQRFTYDAEITVPTGTTVAMGGRLVDARAKGDTTTFVFKSKVPVWRLDIAAAKFGIQRDQTGSLAVYALPGHEEGAARVLKAIRDSISLYTRLFGERGEFQGYTVIEIPDGYGSQAADLYVMQTAAAFEDPKRVKEVYHEVAHTWNAKVEGEVQRCRYFDEAFANYFEALGEREFRGQKAYEDDMELNRKLFLRWVERDRKYFSTPIADYGKHEMGGLSYSKGAWSLYVLHQLVGEERFQKIIRRFLDDYSTQPADFQTFQRTAEAVAGRDLSHFFKEWIYGSESSQLLADNVPVTEIIQRYQ